MLPDFELAKLAAKEEGHGRITAALDEIMRGALGFMLRALSWWPRRISRRS